MSALPLYLMDSQKSRFTTASIPADFAPVYTLGADQTPFGRIARPASVILPSSIILRAR